MSNFVRVLLVEDSAADADLVEWQLVQAGFQVTTRRVETGPAICAALDEGAWDVVICDYRLPQFNAPAALELVRARGIDVPFIVISGSIGEDTAVEMMRGGAQDYVMKDNLARLGPAVARELRDAATRTARRIEADRLAEGRALYEAAAIHMTDGLMIVDPSDRILFWNPRLEELTGVSAAGAVGRSLWDLTNAFYDMTSLPAETHRLSRAARDAALAGTPFTFEYRVFGDKQRDLVVLSFPIRGANEAILGHGRLIHDVTTERELDRLKDDFVSMVSHELRTPMNGVIAMTDLLLESPLDENQRECAEIIRDSGSALVAIVNDILDVSRLQAGRVELENIELDVRAVVEHVVELLAGPARQKGVELVGLVDRAVPQTLTGDPNRLTQVLTNLIGNAVKFTKHGEVSVQIRMAAELAGEVELRCEVVDSGIGAEPHLIAHLFDPFIQADSSVTRRYGGNGLGLSICKRLVDAWGGLIGASSEPGIGSIFWFTVRLGKVDAASAPRLPQSARDLRVLVVDPRATRGAALGELLAGLGVRVEALLSANDVMDLLQRSHSSVPYDVVFITPRDDREARQFSKRLRGFAGDTPPPIVQLIASASATAAMQDQAWPMLSSPARQSQVIDLLTALVDQRSDAPRQLVSTKPTAVRLAAPALVLEDAPRVLVVDDSEVNRRVAVRMLTRLGYHADCSDSGRVALDMLASASYAAILMDCRMPDMDGFTATAEIRRMEGDGQHTPIIAMTANAQQGDRQRCLAAGMDDYLPKPLQLPEMERVLTNSIVSPGAATQAVTAEADGGDFEGVLDQNVLAQIRSLEDPGEPSLLTELVQAFRGSAPGHLARLKIALVAGDSITFEDTAHALKGSAAVVGAARLRFAALDLELLGQANDLTNAAARLIALDATYAEALQALSQEEAQS